MNNNFTRLMALAPEVHAVNKANGFHDKPSDWTESVVLIITELSEAVQADRLGKYADLKLYEEYAGKQNPARSYAINVKGTVQEELADALMRIMDYAQENDIKLKLDHMPAPLLYAAKDITHIAFNATRALIYPERVAPNNPSYYPAYYPEDFNREQSALTIAARVIIDSAEFLGWYIEDFIRLKNEYNKTRGYLHGKRY